MKVWFRQSLVAILYQIVHTCRNHTFQKGCTVCGGGGGVILQCCRFLLPFSLPFSEIVFLLCGFRYWRSLGSVRRTWSMVMMSLLPVTPLHLSPVTPLHLSLVTPLHLSTVPPLHLLSPLLIGEMFLSLKPPQDGAEMFNVCVPWEERPQSGKAGKKVKVLLHPP